MGRYSQKIDFDFEMAAIGQISSNDLHLDAKGSIVRINNPQDLGDDEFLAWAHNNLELSAKSDDIPSGVVARLNRVWRASELSRAGATVDVGTIDISFDLTGLGSVDVTELVLLLDSDGDFSDATAIPDPVAVGSDVYRFESVSGISDGTYFTLGTKDLLSTPLPIELLSFEAQRLANNQVKLTWSTASEEDNSHFTIERSHTFNDFKDIAIIGGAGNSERVIRYEYVDENPLDGINYYRLKQTDFNGTYTHSDLAYVRLQSEEGKLRMKAYPNPIDRGDLLQVEVKSAFNQTFAVSVMDAVGNQVDTFEAKPDMTSIINIETASLKTGIYLIRLTTQNGESTVLKVLIR